MNDYAAILAALGTILIIWLIALSVCNWLERCEQREQRYAITDDDSEDDFPTYGE